MTIGLASISLTGSQRRQGNPDIAPQNTLSPTIAGGPYTGQTLTLNRGTWSGSGISYTYQWFRDGNEIEGATNLTYILVEDDEDAEINAEVTATNLGGSATALSDSITGLAPEAPINLMVPTIMGLAKQGQTLTVSNGNWDNGGAPITNYGYQWMHDGVEIDDAVDNQYTAQAEDVGLELSVLVVATNIVGDGSVISDPTDLVAPPDTAPVNTVLPVADGIPQENRTLTAIIGTWDDGGAPPITYTYQWLMDGDPIGGATNATLALTSFHVGSRISVEVTGTNSVGGTFAVSPETSTIIVDPGSPANTLRPVITGTAREGYILTIIPGEWFTGAEPFTPTYQWYANGVPIDGATGDTYEVQASDIDKVIMARETVTTLGGTTVADTLPTAVVIPAIVVPTNVSLPFMTGLYNIGETIFGDAGTWDDGGGTISLYEYEYRRSTGEVIFRSWSTDPDWVPDNSFHVGKKAALWVRATNEAGTSVEVKSPLSPSIQPAPGIPLSTSKPSCSGTAKTGNTLTAGTNGWNANYSPILSYSYQWYVDDEEIDGATSQTYIVTEEDYGKQIHVGVKATNAIGTSDEAFSNKKAPSLTGFPVPNNTGSPTISGLTIVGEVLTCDPGIWTDGGAPDTTFTYQWQRTPSGVNLSGETSDTLTLTSDHVGYGMRCRVTCTSRGGTKAVNSAYTDAVFAVLTPPVNDTKPSITGDIIAGGTLTGNRGSWSDNQDSNITYEQGWLVNDEDDPDTASIITGETDLTLETIEDMVDRYVYFAVAATNEAGTTGEISNAFGPLEAAAVPDAASVAYWNAMSSEPNPARKAVIDTFVKALKAGNVWDKLGILCLFAAHHEQASRLNLVNPGSGNTQLMGTVNNPTFTVDRGWQGNGSNAYLRMLGYTMATIPGYSQDSATIGAWVESAGANPRISLGIAAGPQVLLRANNATVRVNGNALSFATSPSTGLMGGIRRNSTDIVAKLNGATNATGSISSVAANLSEVPLVLSSNGAYGSDRLAACFFGDQLSDSEWTALYNALRAYLTEVGVA